MPPESAPIPAWGHSTSAQHTAIIESRSNKPSGKTSTGQSKEERKSTTGFPDFLWPQSSRGGGYGSVGEVKYFWTANDPTFSQMIAGGSTWKTQAPKNSIHLARTGLTFARQDTIGAQHHLNHTIANPPTRCLLKSVASQVVTRNSDDDNGAQGDSY